MTASTLIIERSRQQGKTYGMIQLLRAKEVMARAAIGRTAFYESAFWRQRRLETEAGPRWLEADLDLYVEVSRK